MMSVEVDSVGLEHDDGVGREHKIAIGDGVLLGALTGIFMIGVNYLAEKLIHSPFLPFDIFDWIARVLPGNIVTAGIDFLVLLLEGLGPTDRLAKAAERGFALFLFLLLGALMGLLIVVVKGRLRRRYVTLGLLVGLLLGVGAVFVRIGTALLFDYSTFEAASVLILFLSWGACIGYVLQKIAEIDLQMGDLDLTRRAFIYWVGGVAVATTLGSIGLGELLLGDRRDRSAGVPEDLELSDTSGVSSSPSQELLDKRIQPAPGTRPEITSNDDFYTIDINASFQPLDEENWRLEVGGLVRNPLSLTLSELRSRPSITQVITLQCISNRVGGDLTGTTKWTGIPLVDLLEEVDLLPEVKELAIESADGFYESVSMMDILDQRALLVYEMNGEPLPHAHGFPLRIYIPNRYGMKQPKWITRINAIDFEGPGYWVDRGWSEEALVVTTSVIDTDEAPSGLSEGDPFAIGGIAYAGPRGISKVEVQVDNGGWEEAQLRIPALSPLTWVQWRYDWPVKPGTHSFQVRAYDRGGTLQITESRAVRPDGATGIHSQKIRF
jgi:DMSO/TMAO reductase YedYZ molybdopterin-dependent catalytic subunit